ncbi:M12 family metallo-peptidase [Wenzhouxiangella limi]|uniref:Peptidyl-Asp metalloendopeptidase n=1 Tax=Wenzhouxiangella limi TaxID=2707351 RepID=A0A845V294_9GAMM|nr:M12 family metallo-peptidase [Wenzhouxiangella limi]NDY94401.1 hypothetical protein [Wenzhouxiangella limi]
MIAYARRTRTALCMLTVSLLFSFALASASQPRSGSIDFTADDLITRTEIEITFPDGTTRKLIKERVVEYGDGEYVWIGNELGSPSNSVILSVADGAIDGLFDGFKFLSSIAVDADSEATVEELNPSDFQREGEPVVPEEVPSIFRDRFEEGSESGITLERSACTDSAANIRVLVAYTDQTAAATNSVQALINRMIEQANLSFRDSRLYTDAGNTQFIQLELAHIMRVDYPDQFVEGDKANEAAQSSALNHLRRKNSGRLDAVHHARDWHAADIVVLLVNNFGSGVAYLAADQLFRPDEYAFAVVNRSQINAHTFTHEIGHIFGAKHERAEHFVLPWQYQFGHVDVAGFQRTVMSYGAECTDANKFCFRRAIFSSPDLTYWDGRVAGSSGENNRRKMMENAQKVACFRESQETGPSEITVNIRGSILSIETTTPNGGTVPQDLTDIIQEGDSVEVQYTFNWPAEDFSDDPNVGWYREAVVDFRVLITGSNGYSYSWNSPGASVQVDSLDRLDRLIVITGGPIAPVFGTPVFGNTPSYQLVYGNPYDGPFLGESIDIPTSGFLGLRGSIVIQYNDANASGEFVNTRIIFTTTSVSTADQTGFDQLAATKKRLYPDLAKP